MIMLDKQPHFGDFSFRGQFLFDYEPPTNFKDPPIGRRIQIPATDEEGRTTGDTMTYVYSHSYWVGWQDQHRVRMARCHKYRRIRQEIKFFRG